MNWLKKTLSELKYIFLNYFVCNIPLWIVRKFFYRLFGMKIGKGSRILMKTVVLTPQKIRIGRNTYINERCLLDGRDGIEIGDNTTIAFFTKMITGSHNIQSNEFEYVGAGITIGSHVAIFASSVVLAGAVVHDGCVFSAMSLIRKGEYKCGVWGGNPAKYIKERASNLDYEQNDWRPIFR